MIDGRRRRSRSNLRNLKTKSAEVRLILEAKLMGWRKKSVKMKMNAKKKKYQKI
jgi:hypothetical protein